MLESLIDVPCFKCIINKEISPFDCHPESCLKLEVWLSSSIGIKPIFMSVADKGKENKRIRKSVDKKIRKSVQYGKRYDTPYDKPYEKPYEKSKIQCPRCNSKEIVKNGISRYGARKQKFKCKSCGARFVNPELFRFKTTKEIIQYAFQLGSSGYSTRNISAAIYTVFKKRVSHVAVSNWLNNEYLKDRICGGAHPSFRTADIFSPFLTECRDSRGPPRSSSSYPPQMLFTTSVSKPNPYDNFLRQKGSFQLLTSLTEEDKPWADIERSVHLSTKTLSKRINEAHSLNLIEKKDRENGRKTYRLTSMGKKALACAQEG